VTQWLVWIAKSGQKRGKNPLVIARFGNLAELKGGFSGFSDNLLGDLEEKGCTGGRNP